MNDKCDHVTEYISALNVLKLKLVLRFVNAIALAKSISNLIRDSISSRASALKILLSLADYLQKSIRSIQKLHGK